MFKKYSILFFFLSLFLFGTVVLAQPDIGLDTAGNIANQGGLQTAGVKDTTLSETVGRYINILLGFTGAIFLLLMLYAGYLWMFGGGNEENITKAKKIFPSSVIGMGVILLSYSITALIMNFVVGTTAPEPYGELIPTGPSRYSGCCFVQVAGCTKKVGVGRASFNVPCGDCYEDQGESKCIGVSGRWFTDSCVKAQNDFDFRCSEYKGIVGD
ncbi:MAG TPA: pilin [Candidatus Magasanikbacteria bacterium]|nr:pilin [Candidatus Magasanikbacteria bacterium]